MSNGFDYTENAKADEGKAGLHERIGTLQALDIANTAIIEQLRADLVLADALYEAVYGLYHSSGEEDWSEIEPAMKAYGKARGK